MSTINVTKIQHETGVGDNINLDTSGNVEIAGNLEVGGDVEVTGDSKVTGNLEVAGTSDLNGNVDVDGDIVASGDVQATSLNGGQLAGFRNQLINGDFRVWQRGTDFTNSNGKFTADRWCATGTDFTNTTKRVDGDFGQFAQAAELDKCDLKHPIELDVPGHACQYKNGSVWTASLYTNNPSPQFGAYFVNTARDANPEDVIIVAPTDMVATGESEGTLTRYSLTFTINVAPNIENLALLFHLHDFYTGNFIVTGIQLEPGPVATPFEHRPIGTELALCQRYYEVVSSGVGIPSALHGGTQHLANVFYKVSKRSLPTVTHTAAPGASLKINEEDFCCLENTTEVFTWTAVTADAEL